MKFLRRYLLLFTVLAATCQLGFGQISKISSDLISVLNNALQPVDVIVQYNSNPTLLNVTQLLALGGRVNQQYSSVPAIAVKLPVGLLVNAVAQLPGVAFITRDRVVAG